MADTEKLTFDELITHWAQEKPHQTALEQDGEAISFADLEERSRRVVAMLRARGVEKGDRIAWLGKNARHYFELFYSGARLGAVMVPIGWRLAAPEVAYILADTGAKLLFIDEGFDDLAAKACAEMEASPTILDTPTAKAEIDGAPAAQFDPAGADDAVLQLYTSGTTGNPKGAVLTNANLFSLRLPAEAAAQLLCGVLVAGLQQHSEDLIGQFRRGSRESQRSLAAGDIRPRCLCRPWSWVLHSSFAWSPSRAR